MPRWLWLALTGVVIVFAAWHIRLAVDRAGAGTLPSSARNPADARLQEILKQNTGRSGDPDLMQAYRDINTRHFAGALPEVAVRWEPALAGVGALATPPFTQQGVFGHVGKHLIILLNPSVQADPRAQARALSHEMVHVYFYSVGDTSTNHGPAFQAVLQRLSAEGAFEGIAASDSDKASLRDWLDAESARLDHEREAIDALSGEIATGRAGLDREVAALNARITAANAEGRGWPEAAEVSDLEARRARFNERLADSNARIERDRDDLAHFNEEVARYNLMMSYPDGLDEESLMRSKPAPPPAGGPLGRR